MCTAGNCGQKIWRKSKSGQASTFGTCSGRKSLCPPKTCREIPRDDIIVDTIRLQSSVKENAKRFFKCFINPMGMVIQKSSKDCRTIWIVVNRTNQIVSFDIAGNPAYEPINTEVMFPTGIALNPACEGFQISSPSDASKSGPSVLIVVGENGTIAGYNPEVDCRNVVTAVNRVGVIFPTYRGIAIGRYLYAANFASGLVEYYNPTWTFVGEFTDTTMTNLGYSPVNVAIIKSPTDVCLKCKSECKCGLSRDKLVERVFVTYAQKNFASQLVPNTGAGGISVFTIDGQLLYNFAQGGPLNAPWGMTSFNGGKSLAVANFGDGRVNLFDLCTRKWTGSLISCNDQKVGIPGIYSLAKSSNKLFFTAGIDNEQSGLLGYFKPVDVIC